MKRDLTQLTSWSDFDNKLISNQKLTKFINQAEPGHQLARSLIKLRLKKQLSQKDLAIKIGSKQPAISRLESGRSHPSFSLLQKIAVATGSKLTVTFQ